MNRRASSADLVLSGGPNPHHQPVSVSANGSLVTICRLALTYPANFLGNIPRIVSSNQEGATSIVLMEDGRLPRNPAALTDPPPNSPPPSAPEGPNVENALHCPLVTSQSVTHTPTPSTPMSSLGNLNTFIHTLNQELHHSPK